MRIEDKLRELSDQGLRDASPSQEEWRAFRTRGHRRLARRRAGLALAASVAAVVAVMGVQNAGSLLDQNAAPLPPAGRQGSSADDRGPARGAGGDVVVQTWYVKDDLLHLAHQRVPRPSGDATEGTLDAREAVMVETLEQLLAGPPASVTERDAGVRSALAPGAHLLAIELGPQALVDISQLSSGSSRTERELALGQIAATVLQDDDVDSVEVLEDGDPVTDPLTDASYERLLPPIVVTEPIHAERPEPFIGEVVLKGTADVFEATVVYELIDEAGAEVADGFTTATCGTGCRGAFSERIRFEVDAATTATLSVYSPSAEDGSRMFEVSVPVLLCPSAADCLAQPVQDAGSG